MRRTLTTVYAALCTLLLATGFFLTFFFGWKAGTNEAIASICGLLCGFIFAPIIHEFGHVCFAQIAKMDYVYVKFFCFKIYEKNGKKRLGLISPFAADETQVLPTRGGDMRRRACLYTVGGLVFGLCFFLIILAAAIVCTALGATNYFLWGILPYTGYLFLLNAAPLAYESGKTDMLVFIGLLRGADTEKTMISSMEIQGRLSEGKSFSEIEESWYFDLPQLCEDEPLFAIIQDLRYRYFLEKGDAERAAKELNRLAQAQAYLPDAAVEKIAAELTYMHTLFGSQENAEASGKLCWEYLQSDEASAKRILAAYSAAFGKTEAVEPLLAQAEECLKKERVLGVKKHEQILLSRIVTE